MGIADVLSAEALAEAIVESLPEFWYTYADRNPSAVRLHFEGAEGVSFGFPHPLFNQILRTEFSLDRVQIAAIRDQMSARGLPWFWCGRPSTQQEDLTSSLPAAGLVEVSSMPGMAADLLSLAPDEAQPPELEVHEARDRAGLDAFADGILPAYEMPSAFREFFTVAHSASGYYPDFPARIFYGVCNGRPVTGSLVFFGTRVAAIQCVGTIPEARGRGFGGAVVRACLSTARSEGYRYAVLHATKMGFPIYRRLGFTTYFQQGFFMSLAV